VLTWQVVSLILAGVACSAVAQVALKHGMSRELVQSALAAGDLREIAFAVAGSPGVWGGLIVYGISALLWLFVLARVDVSVAYAFVSLGFLLVMALGAALFGEPITWRKLLGTVLVASGVWLVATGVRTPVGARAQQDEMPQAKAPVAAQPPGAAQGGAGSSTGAA
jgi:multidrug transporter EmrE-like cation transporter